LNKTKQEQVLASETRATKLWDAFNAASRQIAYSLTKRLGGEGDEKAYAQAYAKLAQAGFAPKLRLRYRA